uniref:Reverse transcriptase domain-containing protein n=1 Tax=Scylla olivacea TaxID=85551 RepID=A0A0P4WAG8_SCYOL
MDLEKAFETANASAILFIFQGSLSRTGTFENGTPQGSILSPFLFNVLVENIASLNIRGTKILVYADDIAIISTGPSYERRAREAAEAVAMTCQELGLKINTDKTRAMHLGSRLQLP